MKSQSRETTLARALGVAAMTCLLASAQAIARPHVRVGGMVRSDTGAAPTDAQCRAAGFGPCYSPQEIRTAYGLDKLINAAAFLP